MSELQHKSFDLDLKADDGGNFSAYVASFGTVDRTKEVIDIGAFKNLPSFSVDGWVGVNHDMQSLPVAMIDTASQDGRGLLVRAKWHSTPDAQACRAVVTERLAANKSVKCSIGYKVIDSASDFIDGKSVRRLTALEIYEASIVLLPANPAAEVISAKSTEGSSMSEKVLTLDALKSWIEVQLKGGRVLSRANHGQLKEWHAGLSKMCDQIKGMIDLHDPDKDPGSEPDADPDDKTVISAGDGATSTAQQRAAGKSFSKLRASIVRARIQG